MGINQEIRKMSKGNGIPNMLRQGVSPRVWCGVVLGDHEHVIPSPCNFERCRGIQSKTNARNLHDQSRVDIRQNTGYQCVELGSPD